MRIIAGRLRGRRLEEVPVEGVRPTPDRVREALFNILGQNLEGMDFLDLYAGTGAVGLEAVSRGARRVDLVEWDPLAASTCQANVDRLGVQDAVSLVRADAVKAIESYATRAERFDIVFADPPYTDPHETLVAMVQRVAEAGLLAEDGTFVLQMRRGRPVPRCEGLGTARVRDYGITSILMYERQT